MNKKALEDSIFTWIAAFLIILFIMLIYVGLVFLIFTGKELGRGPEVVFEESNVDLALNFKFLNFLGTVILVDGKNQKIIDVLRNSGDPYSDIKNDKGQSLIEVFGLEKLTKEIQNPTTELKEFEFNKYGFTDDDYDAFFDATKKIQDAEFVDEIIKELNKLCDVNSIDKYYLDTPYGVITRDGMKQGGDYVDLFLGIDKRYIPVITHKTNYKGENIEIRFIMLKRCL